MAGASFDTPAIKFQKTKKSLGFDVSWQLAAVS